MEKSEKYNFIKDNLKNMFLIQEAEKDLENELIRAYILKIISDSDN